MKCYDKLGWYYRAVETNPKSIADYDVENDVNLRLVLHDIKINYRNTP